MRKEAAGRGGEGAKGRAARGAEDAAAEDLRGFVAGPFRDVLPARALARGRYTVRDQWLDLLRIPQHPRRVFNLRHLLAVVKRTTDFFGHRRGWLGSFLSRINPYPAPFRRVLIESFDGTLLSGWLGLQSSPRPAVLLVPGMFSSKDDTVHKAKAIRMWRRWNLNVLIVDLRGFGQSGDAPNTPGWKEAEDVIAAARFLHQFNNVTSVGVLSESLGATAALLAAAQEGLWEDEALALLEGRAVPLHRPGPDPSPEVDATGWHLPGASPLIEGPVIRPRGGPALPGGRIPRRVIAAVFALSPFADPKHAVEHIDRMPARRDPFYIVHRLFARLLRMRTGGRHSSFLAFMEESATHYGVTLDTLYARSDLASVVHHVRCPVLVLHAEDDPTVPVRHARILEGATRDRDDFQVWVLPWGRHVEFEILDRAWFWRVVSRFLGQWMGR